MVLFLIIWFGLGLVLLKTTCVYDVWAGLARHEFDIPSFVSQLVFSASVYSISIIL